MTRMSLWALVTMLVLGGCSNDPIGADREMGRDDAGDSDDGPLDAKGDVQVSDDASEDAGDDVGDGEGDDSGDPTCPDGECVVHIDVRTAAVAGTVTVEGDGLTCATLEFVELDGGKQRHGIALPCTGATRAFEGRLPAPRTYAVELFLPLGGLSKSPRIGVLPLVPRFEFDADRTDLSFEVPVVSVSGYVAQNGAPPVAGPLCLDADSVSVRFQDTDFGGGVTAYLPCASFEFDGVTLHRDRSYVVSVSSTSGSTSLPDASSVLRAAYQPSTDDAVFDGSTATVTGSILLDGATPEVSACTTRAALVQFRETTLGTVHYQQLPCDTDWTFEATLPHGTYQVVVGSEQSNLPGSALVHAALTVPAADAVTLDVQTVRVPLTLTMNGGPFPVPANCSGPLATLIFAQPDGFGIYESIPCEGGGAAELALPPGTYQVSVVGHTLPVAKYAPAIAVAAAIELPSAKPLVLDVRMATVSGTVLLDGAPLDDLCDAHPAGFALGFIPLDGESVAPYHTEISCDAGGVFALELPHGAYAVFLEGEHGAVLPHRHKLASRLEVDGARTDLMLEAPVVRVSGSITLDGEQPAEGGFCTVHQVRATLRPAEDPDILTAYTYLTMPCDASAWTFQDVPVTAGSHLVEIDGSHVPNTVLPDRLRLE